MMATASVLLKMSPGHIWSSRLHMKTTLLYFEDYQDPALRLAQQLAVPCQAIELHRFPDGESRIRLPDTLTEHVIVCRSLHEPNHKLIELMLVAKTAREMGVRQLTLVAPYLCYMRQDIAFNSGEAISQKIIGQYLAGLFDNLVTVDPHLHRVHTLGEAVPCKQSLSLSATRLLGEFLATHQQHYILIGPDEESQQWVSTIAETGGFPYVIAHKTRFADKHVKIELPEVNVQHAHVVLVDDMISTGHTMRETAQQLFQQGATSINCLVTHALFAQDTLSMLRETGIMSIWSTDSIIRTESVVQLAELLADGIRSLKLK